VTPEDTTKYATASGGLHPQTPYRDSALGTFWGSFVSQIPWPWPPFLNSKYATALSTRVPESQKLKMVDWPTWRRIPESLFQYWNSRQNGLKREFLTESIMIWLSTLSTEDPRHESRDGWVLLPVGRRYQRGARWGWHRGDSRWQRLWHYVRVQHATHLSSRSSPDVFQLASCSLQRPGMPVSHYTIRYDTVD